MNLTTTLLLGFIVGVTIVFGLPAGQLRRPIPALRVFLNATAVGVLMFLFWVTRHSLRSRRTRPMARRRERVLQVLGSDAHAQSAAMKAATFHWH